MRKNGPDTAASIGGLGEAMKGIFFFKDISHFSFYRGREDWFLRMRNLRLKEVMEGKGAILESGRGTSPWGHRGACVG